MRNVKMIVGNKPIGKARTWAYPNGLAKGIYTIPTYELKVSGADGAGKKIAKSFEVFRFGVQGKSAKTVPRVVGLANLQTHVIKTWLPNYSVHSAISVEMGAWKIYGNFLIHDGPDNPLKATDAYASIGCVEICNGPKGFDVFNDLLISLSGPKAADRGAQLKEIGKTKNMSITFLKAKRPPLTR